MNWPAQDQPLRMIPTDRAVFRKISYGFLGVWFAVFLALFVGRGGCSDKNFWALAVMGLGLFPFERWFYRSVGGVFPAFELHAFFYALSFGISSVLMGEGTSSVSDIQRTLALQATFVGLLSMYCAYYIVGAALFSNLGRLKIKIKIRPKTLLKAAWFWAFFGFGSAGILRFALGDFGGGVGQLVAHLAAFSVTLIFVHLVVAKETGGRTWLAFAVLISLWLMLAFASGAIAKVAEPAILLAAVLLNVRKKVYLKASLLLLLIFVVLNTAKYKMRMATWNGRFSGATSLAKDRLFIKFFMQELNFRDTFGQSGILHNFASRIDHAGLLATVMSMSPNQVPFKNGITYAPLVTVWIPRALWPEKPVNDFGNTWAHWYGLLYVEDRTTSYNLPWLVEFFVNFGWPGIVGGMFLTGILFAWLSVFFCDDEATELEYAVCLSLLVGFWFAESSLALMWGGLIIGGISIALFLKAMAYVDSKT